MLHNNRCFLVVYCTQPILYWYLVLSILVLTYASIHAAIVLGCTEAWALGNCVVQRDEPSFLQLRTATLRSWT